MKIKTKRSFPIRHHDDHLHVFAKKYIRQHITKFKM